MRDEGYVLAVGDLVQGKDEPTGRGEATTGYGIYLGTTRRTDRRGDKMVHGILQDTKSVLVDNVHLCEAWDHGSYREPMFKTAAEVLTDICLAFDDGPEAGTQALGYREGARVREMPHAMATWWQTARGPMMQSRFRQARIEWASSGQAVDQIRKLDGEPSVALQEKYDAAMHKMHLYRQRICDAYASEIAAAQKLLKIGVAPTEDLSPF